jgi:hypothetical protein
MKGRLGAIAVLAVFTATSAAADNPKGIEVLPRWKVGDVRKYELVRTQTKEVPGDKPLSVTVLAPVDVKVAEANDKGFILLWTQGPPSFEDPELNKTLLPQLTMGKLLGDMTIELEIQPDGTVAGLRNWKALRKLGLERLADWEKQPDPAMSKEMRESFRKEIERLWSSREVIEPAFLKDCSLVVTPLGKAVTPDKPNTAELGLPNPLGGDPLPAKREFSLKKQTPERLTIGLKQTLDPEARKVLEKTLQDLAKRVGRPVDSKLPKFDVTTEGEFLVDVKSGWLESCTVTIIVKTDEGSQKQITTLRPRQK